MQKSIRGQTNSLNAIYCTCALSVTGLSGQVKSAGSALGASAPPGPHRGARNLAKGPKKALFVAKVGVHLAKSHMSRIGEGGV